MIRIPPTPPPLPPPYRTTAPHDDTTNSDKKAEQHTWLRSLTFAFDDRWTS